MIKEAYNKSSDLAWKFFLFVLINASLIAINGDLLIYLDYFGLFHLLSKTFSEILFSFILVLYGFEFAFIWKYLKKNKIILE